MSDFGGHIDDAAGVDEEVRGVDDAPAVEFLAVGVGRQLVVGAAGDDAAAQASDGVGVDDAPQGAGGEYVAVGIVNVGDVHYLYAQRAGPLLGGGADVGGDDAGVVIQQVLRGVGCHLAETLHGDGAAAQGILAPGGGGAGAHPHIDAQAGHYGGIAAAAQGGVQADDMTGFLAHGFQVAAGGADVGGSEVASAEGVDKAAPGAQQGFGFGAGGVADDDALAAAQVEAGGGGFVGHGAGETQGVGEGVGFGGVGPHPGAAAGGAQGSVVDGDDAAQAGGGVAVESDLFVALGNHCVEGVHSSSLLPAGAAGVVGG